MAYQDAHGCLFAFHYTLRPALCWAWRVTAGMIPPPVRALGGRMVDRTPKVLTARATMLIGVCLVVLLGGAHLRSVFWASDGYVIQGVTRYGADLGFGSSCGGLYLSLAFAHDWDVGYSKRDPWPARGLPYLRWWWPQGGIGIDSFVPYWIPLVAVLPLAVARPIRAGVERGRQTRRQRAGGSCRACGYDLRGLAEDAACPECGAARA